MGISKPIIKREFLLLKHKIEYLNNINLWLDFWFYWENLAEGGNFFIIPEVYYSYSSRLSALTKKSKIEGYEQNPYTDWLLITRSNESSWKTYYLSK
jgi:hypothetical protein